MRCAKSHLLLKINCLSLWMIHLLVEVIEGYLNHTPSSLLCTPVCCWCGTDAVQLMGKQLHIFIDHFPIWQIFVKHLLCPGLLPGPGAYLRRMTCPREACQVEGNTTKHVVLYYQNLHYNARRYCCFPNFIYFGSWDSKAHSPNQWPSKTLLSLYPSQ